MKIPVHVCCAVNDHNALIQSRAKAVWHYDLVMLPVGSEHRTAPFINVQPHRAVLVALHERGADVNAKDLVTNY